MRLINSILLASICALLPISTSSAQTVPVAIERASGPKLTRAAAHYARSRTMLIAALREFDKATKLVNPEALIDAGHWRETVYDRAEELQRILAPQPRATEAGVRFEPHPGLLGETGLE